VPSIPRLAGAPADTGTTLDGRPWGAPCALRQECPPEWWDLSEAPDPG